MLSLISVQVLTPHKCHKFPCSEVVTYIQGGLSTYLNPNLACAPHEHFALNVLIGNMHVSKLGPNMVERGEADQRNMDSLIIDHVTNSLNV